MHPRGRRLFGDPESVDAVIDTLNDFVGNNQVGNNMGSDKFPYLSTAIDMHDFALSTEDVCRLQLAHWGVEEHCVRFIDQGWDDTKDWKDMTVSVCTELGMGHREATAFMGLVNAAERREPSMLVHPSNVEFRPAAPVLESQSPALTNSRPEFMVDTTYIPPEPHGQPPNQISRLKQANEISSDSIALNQCSNSHLVDASGQGVGEVQIHIVSLFHPMLKHQMENAWVKRKWRVRRIFAPRNTQNVRSGCA